MGKTEAHGSPEGAAVVLTSAPSRRGGALEGDRTATAAEKQRVKKRGSRRAGREDKMDASKAWHARKS